MPLFLRETQGRVWTDGTTFSVFFVAGCVTTFICVMFQFLANLHIYPVFGGVSRRIEIFNVKDYSSPEDVALDLQSHFYLLLEFLPSFLTFFVAGTLGRCVSEVFKYSCEICALESMSRL